MGSPGAVYVNEADELVIQAQGDELLAQMKDVNEEDVTKFLSFAQVRDVGSERGGSRLTHKLP